MKLFESATSGGGLRSTNLWVGIKTMCLLILLQLLQTSDVLCATENLYSPDYSDELEHRVLTESLIPSIKYDKADDLDERYLGSVPWFQSQPMSLELLKRHLGSIASASGGQQRQILSQMEKRYLGSVASKSGFRSAFNKRHLGAFAKINSTPFKRSGEMSQVGEFVGDSGENSGTDMFYDLYPLDVNTAIEGRNVDGFIDNPVSVKTKRFLGSLARSGWFPRQFRGFVAEYPHDKRHLGSAARLGWLPLSKSDRDDNYFGERSGFKRNIQSVKQIQYASPVSTWGWGRPREKRMSRAY